MADRFVLTKTVDASRERFYVIEGLATSDGPRMRVADAPFHTEYDAREYINEKDVI